VALHCTVPAALPSKGLVAAERASRSRRLNTSTSPGSSRRMAFASSGLSVRAPEDFSLKIFPQHSGERRHKPVSLVSARLHKLALWTYTLSWRLLEGTQCQSRSGLRDRMPVKLFHRGKGARGFSLGSLAEY
jgi:hypothetical protein